MILAEILEQRGLLVEQVQEIEHKLGAYQCPEDPAERATYQAWRQRAKFALYKKKQSLRLLKKQMATEKAKFLQGDGIDLGDLFYLKMLAYTMMGRVNHLSPKEQSIKELLGAELGEKDDALLAFFTK